jgi:putative acetyltransferase
VVKFSQNSNTKPVLLYLYKMSILIRPLTENDNQELAKIIRKSLEEFNVPKIGTVYSDPTTDDLFTLFKTNASAYYVAEEDGVLLGGCGVFPTEGLPVGCAELVKLYLDASSRGKGLGRQLLERCFQAAKDLGYEQLYLESFPQLENAVSIYVKMGFKHLTAPLGNSGHHACTIWMLRDNL